MATKSFDNIISDIVDNILIANPSADIKVGSVIRDVFIDPNAYEISNLYVIADSTAQAQSVLTASGQQLDRLASNFNIARKPATRATANVTLVFANGITAPIVLNIGDRFYTQPDQFNNIQTFVNTQTTLLTVGQTQVTIPVINVTAGTAGNVAANTITKSDYSFTTDVYNAQAAENGTNLESDNSFALRIPYSVSGQYVNVYNGIINLIQGINNVVGAPYIVTPDNPISRGMYTTDIYLRENAGYYGNIIQETAPANANDYIFQQQPLFADNPINSVTLVNLANTSNSVAVDPTQYTLIQDGSDIQGFYYGSVKAKQRLHWLNGPPSVPYIISYNVDQPVIDAQTTFNTYNEITNDLLFKKSPDYGLYISLNLTVLNGTDYLTTYQNAYNNLIKLLNGLQIGGTLTKKDVEQAILVDSNIIEVAITNLDTTYQISLQYLDSTGTNIALPSQQSKINPLDYYAQADTNVGIGNPLAAYGIVSSLWIGSPNYIGTTFKNKTSSVASNGVSDSQTIQNLITTPVNSNQSWVQPSLSFYDAHNNVYIINFNALPPTGGGYVNFNLVQPIISAAGTLNYLSLAPSLTSPVSKYIGASTSNQQYVTYLPDALSINDVYLYKNNVPLNPSTISAIGDFTYLNPDGSIAYSPQVDPNTGLINLTFTTIPLTSDVLQFGLLNPNISVNYGTR